MAEESARTPAEIARAERLAEALSRVPETLETDDLVARAIAYLAQIREAAKALRAARLAAERPHREAGQRAADPFREAEARLAEARRQVESRLAAAVRFHADPEADPLVEEVSPGDAPAPAAPEGANPPPAVAVPVAPTVETVDREALDLEALRAHFTEAELRRAAERALEAGRRVRGVRYGRRVAG